MWSKFSDILWNFLYPPANTSATGKRRREDSDEPDSGELAKRLCSMTESRMAGTRNSTSATSRQTRGSTSSRSTEKHHRLFNTDNEVQVWPGEDHSQPRICLPRRPGKRNGSPSRPPLAETQSKVADSRDVPVVVERFVPVALEAPGPGTEARCLEARRRRWAAEVGTGGATSTPASSAVATGARPRRPLGEAASTANGATNGGVGAAEDDDVVVLAETKSPVRIEQKDSGSAFLGLRSFRQMVEQGRVAGRASPFKRPHPKQRSTKTRRSMFDKLMGIAPSQLTSAKRGLSTFACFRLDEKRRYQALLSELSGTSPPASLVDASTSFRTKALLASTPKTEAPESAVALRRERLDPAAASSLMQRISLVDLVSTSSESSQQQQRQPLVNVSSGSEADSRRTSLVSDDVVIERVVPAPPRRTTQLDEDLSRQLKHFSELREKYALSERDRQRQIREEEARRAISCDNHRQWERGLTRRMRRQMRVTPQVALEAEPELSSSEEEEEEEEEPALPELTPEMESKISAALRPSPPSEQLADAFNQRITRHDLQTLKGLNWLNDEVINFYMNMLMERSKNSEQLPKVYCFNTFFYGKIVSQGHQSVRRWTRKVDIFAHDLLIVPVHLGMHWCLACVDLRDRAVRYFDSMGGNNNRGLDAIIKYLRDEHADKKKTPLDTKDWEAVNEKEIPQQMNGSDCGMFACKFADYLSRDARITFTQQDMPYFRRRMVYEIITKKLLQ